MPTTLPEPWLRGPVPGVPPLLQPAAHAFVMAVEDCERAAASLTDEQLWRSPDGAAPVGFHLRHLAGSTDRLLTYARGATLDERQRAALAAEAAPGDPRPTASQLLAAWRAAVDAALAQLRATREASLTDPRAVGRAQLPSTVLGLLFHAAEHASRHTGQVVTTARIVRAGGRV
ncbi:MAG: DinB family protein [Vicinamibacterales bacterium]